MTQSSTLGDVLTGSGAAVRTGLNSSDVAIITENEGNSTPSPTYPFMLWRNDTTKLLKRRNSTDNGWEILLNYGATAGPTTGDDTADGYIQGSWWYDVTNKVNYICTDPAAGAAVWVNIAAGGGALTADSVTNTYLANMAQDRIKGRVSSGSGDPEDLTAAQVRTMINVEDGATAEGTSGDAYAISHEAAAGAAHSVATQSINGFMSAADKTALDNLSAASVFALDGATVPTFVDNTTNNVTTGHHGFMPKLDGDANHFYCSDGTQKAPSVSATAQTRQAAYANDPTFADNDTVIESYLGSRITLPAYDAGKQNLVHVVNPGLVACNVRAYAAASVVNGFKVVDISGSSATRFVLGVNSPATVGNKLTISFWLREDSHTNNRGILHFGNGIETAASHFRITSTYVSGLSYLQIESRNASTNTVIRRYPFSQGPAHHCLISADLSGPSLTVVIDGIIVSYDTSQAGSTLTSAQPFGGSNQPVRLGTSITSVCEELAGSLAQLVMWQNCWSSITEQRIRQFYNDGPVSLTTTTAVNGTNPFIFLNTLPTGSPAAASNTGSLGGTFTDSYGSGVSALDVANLDSAMLEQIDGFPQPDGFTLPVGKRATFIRRASNGVWGVF